MPYPESFIGPMREELTRLGVKELRTAADVDALLTEKGQTVMVVVNSMCGCAAGRARPGVALALKHTVKPEVVAVSHSKTTPSSSALLTSRIEPGMFARSRR